MNTQQHNFEIDIDGGSFNHLPTKTLEEYLVQINRSAHGSNPAYHAKMKHAADTIRFLIHQRENGLQQSQVLRWTRIAAIAAIIGCIIGIVAIALQQFGQTAR